MVRIALVGSYGVGMTMRLARMPFAGETMTAGPFSSGPGGKGSNQAIGASRLGATVRFCSAIGNDDLGAVARELWQHEGVDDTAVVTIPDTSTMVGMILVEPDGANRIVIAPGALDHLESRHVEEFADAIAEADLCVVGLEVPLAPARRALELARDAGTRTLLNPAPAPDHALPIDLLQTVDVLTPNEIEARVLAGHSPDAPLDHDVLLADLRTTFDGLLLMTMGEGGVLVADGDTHEVIPAFVVPEVVDTTGAGDAFNAAVAVALAQGATPRAAALHGVAAGAHAVQHAEVVPSLPHASALPKLAEVH